ncbi:MAG TPA: DinB family protein [Thermoanaerobaculia bacterium]|nr:DinB family protein [Thermoanaerobaculia bacterium]
MSAMVRDELVQALDRTHEDGVAFWGAFDTPHFFAKLGDAWSPAENVRHLIKSIRPVTKALTMPRFVLRLMFGASRRPSVSFDELRTRYLGLLEAGGNAGRFAPTPREEADLESWRATIMSQLATANRELRAAILKWPENKLDRYTIPHPLLGKLTVREMLMFTIYHQTHHVDVVKRRMAA